MSIIAQGQITLVDIGDLGELSVIPQSNQPTMVVYDPETQTYSPNWATNHLILTPIITYGSTNISPSNTTLKWYYQIGTSTRQEIISGNPNYSITNGVLTVLSNILASYSTIAYSVEVTYTEPNTGTALHAIGQISFAKVANGNQVKSITITGGNALLYNSNGTCRNSPVVLTATVQNATFSNWQYNTGASWSNISGASSNTLSVYDSSDYFNNDVAYLRAVATDSNVYDECNIVKIRDGAPGDTVDSVILSNESQMVPCDQNNDPVTGAFTNCTTTITIYEGNEDHTSEWTISVDTNHGVAGTYNSSTHVFSATGLSATTGYVVFTCTKTGHATLTKTYSLVKVKAGADGQPGTSPTIYTLDVDSIVVNKAENGTLTPSVIHLNGYSQTGDAARTAYTGWLKILNANGTVVSSSRASAMTYTVPSNATKLTAQLCASASSSVIYDTQTILMVSDGASGSSGAAALNFILGNYSDVIPCTNEGKTASAQTITIPYAAYLGASRIACTASYSTLPSGMSYNSYQSQTGTTERDGKLVFNVGANENFGNNSTMTGTITITITANGKSNNQTYTWTKNNKAKDGTDGQPGSPGYNNATIQLYKRSATTPTKPTAQGDYTYTFATGTITPTVTGGWINYIPENDGNPCYIIMASVRSTDPTASFAWSEPILLVENGKDGDKYTVKVNTDTIYRYYNVNTFVTSQGGYELALVNRLDQPLATSQYSVIISMLPTQQTDSQNPTTKEIIMRDGYTNIIEYFNNDIQQEATSTQPAKPIFEITASQYKFNLANLMEAEAISGSTKAAELIDLNDILRTREIVFVASFVMNNEVVHKQLLHLNTLLDNNLATFTNTAVQIQQAVTEAHFNWSAEGLSIEGGKLVITDQYKTPILQFNTNSSGYGNLEIWGTIHASGGEFNGTVKATDGEFTGKVTVGRDSTIAGFTVDNSNNLVSANNEIILDGTTGHITANSITLGTNAVINDYIQLGINDENNGNAYIYNPDLHNGKILEAGLLNSAENGYIVINKNGMAQFGNIYIDGRNSSLYGRNWHIGIDEAEFSNINVSGKIRTAVFEAGHISAVSGAMIFRPATKIVGFANVDNNTHTTSNIIVDDVSSFTKRNGQDYIITIGNITAQTISIDSVANIITLNTSVNVDPNSENHVEIGQSVVNLGNGYPNTTTDGDNILIGVNSMSDSMGGFVPQALSILELSRITNNNTESFAYDTRLLLGNLAGVETPGWSSLTGYGLYADNVYLNGSLTTKYIANNTIGYAGINTLSSIDFIYDQVDSSSSIDTSPIILWAGSTGIDSEEIKRSKFQVTANGTVYAQHAVIENSLITGTEIRSPRIFGTGDGPALKIFSTSSGIVFYDINNNQETAIWGFNNNGFYYKNNTANPFIEINTSTNIVTFKGLGDFTAAEIGNIVISNNDISNNDSIMLDTPKIYFADTTVSYVKVSGGYDLFVTPAPQVSS